MLLQSVVNLAPDLLGPTTTQLPTRAVPPGLRVEAHGSLRALLPLAAQLDALNLASRRPSPFDTFAYLEAFVAHDEHARPGQAPLFLVAMEGDALVGFLALRRVPERLFGVPFTSISFLVGHDNDRPRVLSRPTDEARCAEAFYRHLLEVERGWDLLQLQEQDAASALLMPPPSLDLRRYFVRHFPNNPNGTIPVGYASIEAYVRACSKPRRRAFERSSRKLRDTGELELLIARDPRSTPAIFDLYLDLEQRSWKVHKDAHIGRHPERVRFFRRLLSADQPMKISLFLLMLDGLPIGGLVAGDFGGTRYGLEEAFDEDHRDLSPGNATMLLLIRDAIERSFSAVNLLGNYAYYKAQWQATITETQAVQVYRKGSLVHLKALAGQLWREIRAPITQRDVGFNLVRRGATRGAGEAAQGEIAPAAPRMQQARPPRDAERARARATIASLEASGATIERLGGADLRRALALGKREEAT